MAHVTRLWKLPLRCSEKPVELIYIPIPMDTIIDDLLSTTRRQTEGEVIDMVRELTQDVSRNVKVIKEVIRGVSNNQSRYANVLSVYELFINVLATFLALCRNSNWPAKTPATPNTTSLIVDADPSSQQAGCRVSFRNRSVLQVLLLLITTSLAPLNMKDLLCGSFIFFPSLRARRRVLFLYVVS